MPIKPLVETTNDNLSIIFGVNNIIYNWPFYREHNSISPLSLCMDGTNFINRIAASDIIIRYRTFSDWTLWALDKCKDRPDIDKTQVQFVSFLSEFYKYISYELRAIELEDNIITQYIGTQSINEWFNNYFDKYREYIQRTVIDPPYTIGIEFEDLSESEMEIPELEEAEVYEIMNEEETYFREYDYDEVQN